MCKKVVLKIVIIGLFFNTSYANHSTKKNLTTQQQDFLAAEKALKRGSSKTFKTLKNKLKDYELYPYLEYSEFRKNITQVSRKQYEALYKKYEGTYLQHKFYKTWVNQKSKKKQWNAFLSAYKPKTTDSKSEQCTYLYAMTKQNKTDEIYSQVLNIWLHGKSLPKACNPLIDEWKARSLITRPAIWQRIKLAIQANNTRLARYLSKSLDRHDRHYVNLWVNVHKKPDTIKNKKLFRGKHPAIVEILTYGVTKIAKKDVKEATKIWKRISNEHKFSDRHWAIMVREIGLSLSFAKHEDAYNWLDKVPAKYANDTVLEWKIRAAISKNSWDLVIKSINKLPERLFKDEKWQYWLARSLELRGYKTKSQKIYQELAQTRSYYGFLSSLKSNKNPTLKKTKTVVPKKEITQIAQNKDIKRIKELLALDRTSAAKSEWNFTTAKFNEKDRQSAAQLAASWGLHNWSITTLSKASNKNNLKLRFPVLYNKHIKREAKNNKIEPALIYALTRQESAFIPNAKSPVGALGLMQVMPGTAKHIAKKYKIKLRSNKQLLEPSINIKLGSKYLKDMISFNNNSHVLAIASYNAGPHNVKKWIPSKKMSADAWIETIPFHETRNYVQNILTYTIIYQDALGQKANLIPYLKPIRTS